MTEENAQQKLARLRDEKRKREEQIAQADEAFELRELELDDEMSQKLGRRGADWALVSDKPTGTLVVVKRGADLSFRKYVDAIHAADEKGIPSSDLYDFTAPCVVLPSSQEYAELVRKHGFIANRAAQAVASLHGVREKKLEGKF